jgi:hypothetical protein
LDQICICWVYINMIDLCGLEDSGAGHADTVISPVVMSYTSFVGGLALRMVSENYFIPPPSVKVSHHFLLLHFCALMR